jgi:hypothetical protein
MLRRGTGMDREMALVVFPVYLLLDGWGWMGCLGYITMYSNHLFGYIAILFNHYHTSHPERHDLLHYH